MKTIQIPPPILDACCGGRMFYFDKEDERVIFQDIRDEEIPLTMGENLCTGNCTEV